MYIASQRGALQIIPSDRGDFGLFGTMSSFEVPNILHYFRKVLSFFLFKICLMFTLISKYLFLSRFDTNGDQQMNITEFNALAAAVGDLAVDADALGLAFLAQDIPITPQGTITKESFFKVISLDAKQRPR